MIPMPISTRHTEIILFQKLNFLTYSSFRNLGFPFRFWMETQILPIQMRSIPIVQITIANIPFFIMKRGWMYFKKPDCYRIANREKEIVNNYKSSTFENQTIEDFYFVVPPGIEPGTKELSKLDISTITSLLSVRLYAMFIFCCNFIGIF